MTNKFDPLKVMLLEEASEVIASEYGPGELDGLLDSLGVIIKMLSRYKLEERVKAVEEYNKAQLDKGRPIRNHNRVILELVSKDDNFSLSDTTEVAAQQSMDLNKRIADKTQPRTQKALAILDSLIADYDQTKVKHEPDDLGIVLYSKSVEIKHTDINGNDLGTTKTRKLILDVKDNKYRFTNCSDYQSHRMTFEPEVNPEGRQGVCSTADWIVKFEEKDDNKDHVGKSDGIEYNITKCVHAFTNATREEMQVLIDGDVVDKMDNDRGSDTFDKSQVLPLMILEESSELFTSDNDSDRLDAIADLLSCLLAYLSLFNHDEREYASEAFIDEQKKKGTILMSRHQSVVDIMTNEGYIDRNDGLSLVERQYAEIDKRLAKSIPRIEDAYNKIK